MRLKQAFKPDGISLHIRTEATPAILPAVRGQCEVVIEGEVKRMVFPMALLADENNISLKSFLLDHPLAVGTSIQVVVTWAFQGKQYQQTYDVQVTDANVENEE